MACGVGKTSAGGGGRRRRSGPEYGPSVMPPIMADACDNRSTRMTQRYDSAVRRDAISAELSAGNMNGTFAALVRKRRTCCPGHRRSGALDRLCQWNLDTANSPFM